MPVPPVMSRPRIVAVTPLLTVTTLPEKPMPVSVAEPLIVRLLVIVVSPLQVPYTFRVLPAVAALTAACSAPTPLWTERCNGVMSRTVQEDGDAAAIGASTMAGTPASPSAAASTSPLRDPTDLAARDAFLW